MRVVTTINIEHEVPDGTEGGNLPHAAWDWAKQNIQDSFNWEIISTVVGELSDE